MTGRSLLECKDEAGEGCLCKDATEDAGEISPSALTDGSDSISSMTASASRGSESPSGQGLPCPCIGLLCCTCLSACRQHDPPRFRSCVGRCPSKWGASMSPSSGLKGASDSELLNRPERSSEEASRGLLAVPVALVLALAASDPSRASMGWLLRGVGDVPAGGFCQLGVGGDPSRSTLHPAVWPCPTSGLLSACPDGDGQPSPASRCRGA